MKPKELSALPASLHSMFISAFQPLQEKASPQTEGWISCLGSQATVPDVLNTWLVPETHRPLFYKKSVPEYVHRLILNENILPYKVFKVII